jgi:hypothetical protein
MAHACLLLLPVLKNPCSAIVNSHSTAVKESRWFGVFLERLHELAAVLAAPDRTVNLPNMLGCIVLIPEGAGSAARTIGVR